MAARPPEEVAPKARPVPKGPEFAPQQAFRQAAVDLATVLGWGGVDEAGRSIEEHWLQNDISVADARNYLQQKLHEAHQAGVLQQPMPAVDELFEHLAVDTLEEVDATQEALQAAYATASDPKFIEEQQVRFGYIKANLVGSAGVMLGAAGRIING